MVLMWAIVYQIIWPWVFDRLLLNVNKWVYLFICGWTLMAQIGWMMKHLCFPLMYK